MYYRLSVHSDKHRVDRTTDGLILWRPVVKPQPVSARKMPDSPPKTKSDPCEATAYSTRKANNGLSIRRNMTLRAFLHSDAGISQARWRRINFTVILLS